VVAPDTAALIEPFANPQLALPGVRVIVGFALTTTATVFDAVQPSAAVPMTV
jgi:hypothetical protein